MRKHQYRNDGGGIQIVRACILTGRQPFGVCTTRIHTQRRIGQPAQHSTVTTVHRPLPSESVCIRDSMYPRINIENISAADCTFVHVHARTCYTHICGAFVVAVLSSCIGAESGGRLAKTDDRCSYRPNVHRDSKKRRTKKKRKMENAKRKPSEIKTLFFAYIFFLYLSYERTNKLYVGIAACLFDLYVCIFTTVELSNSA